MIKISYPYKTAPDKARATLTINRRGQEPIVVCIDYGMNKYDTFKLIITPSRAVNPPYSQYIGGVRLDFAPRRETDNRVEETNSCIVDALEKVVEKGHITAITSQTKQMFRKLDKLKVKE